MANPPRRAAILGGQFSPLQTTTIMKSSSWKTTVAGIAAILAAISTAVAAQFDADPNTVPNWGVVVTAVCAGAGLLAARDNDKSSEQVGAKS